MSDIHERARALRTIRLDVSLAHISMIGWLSFVWIILWVGSQASAQSTAIMSTDSATPYQSWVRSDWRGEVFLSGSYGRLRELAPLDVGSDEQYLVDFDGSAAAQLWFGVYFKRTGGQFLLDWCESKGQLENETDDNLVHSGRSVFLHAAAGHKLVLKKNRNWWYIEPVIGYGVLLSRTTTEDTTGGTGQSRSMVWEHGLSLGIEQSVPLNQSTSIFLYYLHTFYSGGAEDRIRTELRISFPGDRWEDPGRIFVGVGFRGSWRDSGRGDSMLHLGFGGYSMY